MIGRMSETICGKLAMRSGALANLSYIILPLKPHVCHQRVYGMGTSGFMLIPVTPPIQCVAECAKCGFSGQANTAWGPSSRQSGGPSPKRSPILNGHLSYIEAYVCTKCMSQNSSCARNYVCCIQSLFDTQANHRMLFGAPRRIRIGTGVWSGCAMAVER